MNTASVKPTVATVTKSGTINVQFSGSIPRNYDEHLGPLFFEPFAEKLAERVAALDPQAVLELACGTGRLTRHLAKRLDPAVRIAATDINPAMLGFAQQGLPTAGVEWNTVDAVDLPYADATFDVVVAQFGVMFYSDRSKAYREAVRVLKPGGRLLFTCWNSIEDTPTARITQSVVDQFFPVDPPAFYTIPFAYHESMLIREEVLTAGFGRVQMELLELEGAADTAANAARGLLEGSPIHTAITDRDPFLLPVMRTELEYRLAARFGARSLRVPLSAWAVEARVH
jgi:ubiquinone/menaquinone biosynthesis C-methylase UbiE